LNLTEFMHVQRLVSLVCSSTCSLPYIGNENRVVDEFYLWITLWDVLELVDSCWAFLQSNLNFIFLWRIIIVPLLLTMKILFTSFLESTGVLCDMTIVNAWPTSKSDTSESHTPNSESFRSLFYQSLKKITFELFRVHF
jgi:hypothetical protein